MLFILFRLLPDQWVAWGLAVRVPSSTVRLVPPAAKVRRVSVVSGVRQSTGEQREDTGVRNGLGFQPYFHSSTSFFHSFIHSVNATLHLLEAGAWMITTTASGILERSQLVGGDRPQPSEQGSDRADEGGLLGWG